MLSLRMGSFGPPVTYHVIGPCQMLAALMDLGRGRYQTSNSHKPLIRISMVKATRPAPPATGSSARPVIPATGLGTGATVLFPPHNTGN